MASAEDISLARLLPIFAKKSLNLLAIIVASVISVLLIFLTLRVNANTVV